MNRCSGLIITLLGALGLLLCGSALAKTSYLNSVNSTCNTSYGCDLCHNDINVDKSLNQEGQAFKDSGNDPNYLKTVKKSALSPCLSLDLPERWRVWKLIYLPASCICIRVTY